MTALVVAMAGIMWPAIAVSQDGVNLTNTHISAQKLLTFNVKAAFSGDGKNSSSQVRSCDYKMQVNTAIFVPRQLTIFNLALMELRQTWQMTADGAQVKP